MFPSASGDLIAKLDVVIAIQGNAGLLQLPLVTPTGTLVYTGQTLRVPGAVHLAKSGIDTWRIQLHGRWGSAAVFEVGKAISAVIVALP